MRTFFIITSLLALLVGRSAWAVTDSINVSLSVNCIDCADDIETGSGGGAINDSGDDAGGGGGGDDGGSDGDGSGDQGAEGGGGGGPTTAGLDPFELIPFASNPDPLIDQLVLADFIFSQPGEPQRVFNTQDLLTIDPAKRLTISLAEDKVPAVLKTIAMSIFDPQNPAYIFSFVLRHDEAAHVYTATLAPLGRDGWYPFSIHVLNFEDQRIKRLRGFLAAGAAAPAPPLASLVNDLVEPLVAGSAALAGASSLLLASAGARSLYDIYLLAVRGLGALLGYFGVKQKRRPWGTVYDAITKRPLDPAYVSVRQNGKEVATAITDIDGRYNLVLPQGEYELVVNKTHYRFPSQLLAGRTHDEVYTDLYFGGPVRTGGQEVPLLNIPLDPLAFDWNEFIKNRHLILERFIRVELAKSRLFNIMYGVGVVLSVAAAVFVPSILNLSVLAVYLALYLITRVVRRRQTKATLKDELGRPLAYALIRMFVADVNQEVKTVVTDDLGRFLILVRPGRYYFTVDEKMPDGHYEHLHQSGIINLPTGVLAEDIIVKRV